MLRMEASWGFSIMLLGGAMAEQVSKGLRARLAPEEIELAFGVKISGEVGWWFFAKASGEASINVTLRWTNSNPNP